MKKTCLIRCPAGLGDILFVQKIGRKLIDKGYEVYWPVIKPFGYIKDYIDGINWIQLSVDHPDGSIENDIEFPGKHHWNNSHIVSESDHLFVNLHHPDQFWPHELIMKCKYKLVDLDCSDWSNYVNITRNTEKENKLFYDVLNLKDDDEYCLVNEWYGSPPWCKKVDNVQPSGKYKRVDLTMVEGYNPFDWCKVFANATEIHTVDTCFQYLFEIMELKSTNISVYSRTRLPSAPSYVQTQWMFNKQYKWVHN